MQVKAEVTSYKSYIKMLYQCRMTHFYGSFKDVEFDGDFHFSVTNDEANVKYRSGQMISDY